MTSVKKVSIIGTGAIGATFASTIHDYIGEDLRIIASDERYDRYEKNGFVINGKAYDFNYVKPEETVEKADLILIAVKYHHLDQVVKEIENHVGEDTIILSLLNGINSEEIISQYYNMEQILYSLVFKVDATRDGNKITHSLPGTIAFGEEKNDTHSKKVKKVKAFFDAAGVDYEIPKDMIKKMWWKFMVNVGINQSSAILKAPYGVFQSSDEALELLKDTMQEVIILANVLGVDLEENDMDTFIDLLFNLSKDGKTSMLQDVLAKRKTEVEMFAKVVCDLGNEHNLKLPINEMMYKMIKVIEDSY
jgi:2-dehydropantoate 2-reductase